MNLIAPVTLFYAAILGAFYMLLLLLVIKLRHQHKLGHGDGGHSVLRARVRAHANFAEYTPLLLLFLLLVELNQAKGFISHGFGISILISRAVHAYGMIILENKEKPSYKGRVFGTVITVWLHIIFATYAFCILVLGAF